MTGSLELTFTVDPKDFAKAGEASAETKRILKAMGMDAEVVRRVAIAIYEGEINMVIHANGGEIKVTIGDDDITMVLCDNGPGIADIEKAMQAGYSTASENIRGLGFGAGMGMSNMKKYTDEFKVDSEEGVGTTVTMKVYLGDEE